MKNSPQHILFGVICDTTTLFAWQEIVVKKLLSEAGNELKLVIFENESQNKERLPSSQKSGFLWDFYYRYVVGKKSKALQLMYSDELFEGISKVYFNLVEDHNEGTILHDSDIDKIKNYELDFIIDFSSLKLQGKVFNSCKYGIWSYQFGDPEKYMGSISCFWEIYHEDVLTKACLKRLTNVPDSIVLLKEGYLKTNASYTKNIDNIYFEATGWPLQVCQDIKNNSIDNFKISSKLKPGKFHVPPGNLRLVIFFLIQIKLLIKRLSKLIFYTDYWNIGIALSPIQEFLNNQKVPQVQWFSGLPRDRFMADPFGLYHNENLHIIYEDLRFDQRIGKTASFLFKNDSFIENKIVIDEKFHMSYPFLMEYENEIYCIPETYQANQVRLYKAIDFPEKWKLEKILIDDYAGIDNTPFEHEGTWFLFSTDKNSGPHHNLNIHYANNIFGPWVEHPKNPVKTDIRSARPAGTIFEHDGAIFRPSMDYSEKIEGRIVINKIVKLTIHDFREEAHSIVNPFKNTFFSDKVHTLSQVGPFTLVDGAKELFIFSNFYALKYKLNRILLKLKNR